MFLRNVLKYNIILYTKISQTLTNSVETPAFVICNCACPNVAS